MEMETIIMELVVNSGEARNKAMEAIEAAEHGDFETAAEKMQACSQTLEKAHEFQTKLLSDEAGGESTTPVSLILIHGQDHLMNAMTVRDLACHMISMCRIMYKKSMV